MVWWKRKIGTFRTEGLKRRDHVADVDLLGRVILDYVFDK